MIKIIMFWESVSKISNNAIGINVNTNPKTIDKSVDKLFLTTFVGSSQSKFGKFKFMYVPPKAKTQVNSRHGVKIIKNCKIEKPKHKLRIISLININGATKIMWVRAFDSNSWLSFIGLDFKIQKCLPSIEIEDDAMFAVATRPQNTIDNIKGRLFKLKKPLNKLFNSLSPAKHK